jgi:hypothetical protein
MKNQETIIYEDSKISIRRIEAQNIQVISAAAQNIQVIFADEHERYLSEHASLSIQDYLYENNLDAYEALKEYVTKQSRFYKEEE